jgi:hypothetical protein
VTVYSGLTDEVFIHHIVPKLDVSDWLVLARVDRHTRTLVQAEARVGKRPILCERLCHLYREASLGAAERLSLECVAMPMELEHVFICRFGRASRGAEVGVGARLPVGRADVCICRLGRASRGA